MKISEKLKSLTLGAILSAALAFLIVHPGMFPTVQAESDFEFSLEKYVESIDDPRSLHGESLSIPFYPGRPIYDGDITYNTDLLAEFGFWALMSTLFAALVWTLTQILNQLANAWYGIVNSSDRKRLREWLNKTGYGKDVGKSYCSGEEGREPDYSRCRADEVTKFIRAFAAKSTECGFETRVVGHAGTVPIIQTAEMHYDLAFGRPKVWVCAYVQDIPTPIGTMTIIEKHWEWDAGPYL